MTGQDRRVSRIAFAVMVALIVIAPFFAYPFFVMQAMCFALFACAFNLLIGYANLLSLGHAMFFGLASYVCAHAAKVWGLEPVSAIAAGVAASAALGFVTGALAIRSAGIYFAMITVAFSQEWCSSSASEGASFTTMARTASKRCRRGARSASSICPIPGSLYTFVAVVFRIRVSHACSARSIRRSARFSRRSAKTSRAPFRSAIAPCNSKLAAFVLSAVIAASPARPRRWSSRTRR